MASVPIPQRAPGANRVLSPADEVAALLLAMGKPAAGRLLKYFEPDEIRRITRSATQHGTVSARQLEDIVEMFSDEFASDGAAASWMGSTSVTRSLSRGTRLR